MSNLKVTMVNDEYIIAYLSGGFLTQTTFKTEKEAIDVLLICEKAFDSGRKHQANKIKNSINYGNTE